MAWTITFAKGPTTDLARRARGRDNRAMELYGLRSITHGWGRLLHVMSPDGAATVLYHIEAGEAFMVVTTAGAPVQFHQAKGGLVDELIARYGIVELDLPAWNAKKDELGDAAVWDR